ncbi:MAG: hypothetical protein ACRC4M_03260 [Mycoplasma sp.]
MKKQIIWDLFGGGQNSVYKTLQENDMLDQYEVYTFDVTEPTREHHYKLDLAQDDIIEIFKQFPKPDIILSSTLCQSWSCVLNMKGGGTCFWTYEDMVKKEKLKERSIEEFERLKSGYTANKKADVQLFITRLGKKCADNTIKLIEHYKPKYWYIENPNASLLWRYVKFNRTDFYNPETMFFNKTKYSSYGFPIQKATIFLSNVEMKLLNLPKEKLQYHIETINGVDYKVLTSNPAVKMKVSLKSGMLGLSSLQKGTKSPVQKDKMVNEQICESGENSAIPHDLIKHIFTYFK